MVAVFKKIDESRDAQLEKINERKKEAMAKLEQKYATTKTVKGPLTFIVILIVCLLAILVLFLDSFRLFKYLRKIFKQRSKNKVNPIENKSKSSINLNNNDDETNQTRRSNNNYKDLEYNLYVSFMIAKKNGTLRTKTRSEPIPEIE
jgi:hypothetical protein